MALSKALVLLSGGVDSATALWDQLLTRETHALTFKFHECNRREVQASKALCKIARIKEHIIVDVGFLKDLSEYASLEIIKSAGVNSCYIPSRNAIFFSIASHFAEIHNIERIVSGHCSEDKFPDTTKEFFIAITDALNKGRLASAQSRLEIIAPFCGYSKYQVLKRALDLQVPLGLTWSCYGDGEKECGECPGCKAKREAFQHLGLTE